MATQEFVPVYTNPLELCRNLGGSVGHEVARWDNLAQEFTRRFGRKPEYITRAPGRINLIGEHIDYALFGVLPTAIERDILVACAAHPMGPENPGTVIADNLRSTYKREKFSPLPRVKAKEGMDEGDVHAEEWYLDIDTKQLRWESYVKAGYCGILNHYFSPSTASSKPVPVDLLVTGTVPAGSGLSSSAALVVASTLAFLAVNGKLGEDAKMGHLTKGDLVRMAMENEQRVGVKSGGMDQAASVISVSSSALYVTFLPALSATLVPLPHGAVFVCANSLVVSDKVVNACTRYNLRVVETQIGAWILGQKLGVVNLHGVSGNRREMVTYREVLGRLIGEDEHVGGEVGVQMLREGLRRIEKELEVLKPHGTRTKEQLGLTLQEMVALSGLEEAVFMQMFLDSVNVEATHFQLYKRAKHVFSEASRVLDFREICLLASSHIPRGSVNMDCSVFQDIGNIMNESQDSCSSLFECSCPELDLLTKIQRDAGAFGSRLTGAGWGGCTVSLVLESQVDPFIQKVKESYPAYNDLYGEQLNEVIFATRPGSGACVLKLD